jgi:hypothetical protein
MVQYESASSFENDCPLRYSYKQIKIIGSDEDEKETDGNGFGFTDCGSVIMGMQTVLVDE